MAAGWSRIFPDGGGYWQERDPVLTVMLSAALPASIGLAWWEWKVEMRVMHRPFVG